MWNIGKNIISVLALVFIFIGMPVLITRHFGINEDIYFWNLTYQEVAGLGGFLLFVAALLSWYFYFRIKGGGNRL